MAEKKIFQTIILAVLIAILVSACSGATPTPEQVEIPVEVTRVVQGTPVVETMIITPTSPVEPTQVPASAENPIELRLGTVLTADQIETWMPLFGELDANHPEWILIMEQTPFASVQEKLAASIAAGTLPCVQEVNGLFALPYIRDGAFLAIDDFIDDPEFNKDDFYPVLFANWTSEGKIYGIPHIASPEVLFYNKDMFDAAGLDYPNDDWTFEDLKANALQLSLDSEGRNATDPNFDTENIVQWGFNANPGGLGIWAHYYVEPFGGNFCADEECTELSMTDPEDIAALEWWYDLVQSNGALFDPYSGAQTGVPGDPFVAGFAAMGYNNVAGIGQLKASGAFDFGVAQPPMGSAGRSGAFSDTGYAIAANCPYPEEAWKLMKEITSTDFLTKMWALPGHSVPGRESAAQAILQLEPPPDDLSPALKAFEYSHSFRPNVPGSFEAFVTTSGIALQVFAGDLGIEEGYTQIEQQANDILEANR
jgi:multiple sugar transport system substrate-binding protein